MARSPLILDRYRVIGQAGAGGYGTVVHAFDTHLKRDVAIKSIELSEDEVARARLVALEARMAADLEGTAGSAPSAARTATPHTSGARAAAAPSASRAVPTWDEQCAAVAAERAGAEVPPWDDDAADGEEAWEETMIPWSATTTDFAGAAAGPARLEGRVSRKTRHAPEAPYEPAAEVDATSGFTSVAPAAEEVDVRHLRGVRASRVIAEEPPEPEEV
ncbi:MAG: hypothetical protein HFJ72_01125, partial [Adlercreutzia sp.]|nr:hypothetical protein [Adlercreutzia sp.]